MTVERYFIMDVAVEMTQKYGCMRRPRKCGCRKKYLSVTFSERVLIKSSGEFGSISGECCYRDDKKKIVNCGGRRECDMLL